MVNPPSTFSRAVKSTSDDVATHHLRRRRKLQPSTFPQNDTRSVLHIINYNNARLGQWDIIPLLLLLSLMFRLLIFILFSCFPLVPCLVNSHRERRRSRAVIQGRWDVADPMHRSSVTSNTTDERSSRTFLLSCNKRSAQLAPTTKYESENSQTRHIINYVYATLSGIDRWDIAYDHHQR